jgi:hypothetical protein
MIRCLSHLGRTFIQGLIVCLFCTGRTSETSCGLESGCPTRRPTPALFRRRGLQWSQKTSDVAFRSWRGSSVSNDGVTIEDTAVPHAVGLITVPESAEQHVSHRPRQNPHPLLHSALQGREQDMYRHNRCSTCAAGEGATSLDRTTPMGTPAFTAIEAWLCPRSCRRTRGSSDGRRSPEPSVNVNGFSCGIQVQGRIGWARSNPTTRP